MAMDKLKVKLKRLSGEVRLPRYETPGSSGMDLLSVIDTTIEPRGFEVVPTGLALEIPEGYEAQVRPRSGLASKQGIGILNSPGTIDSDYRGEVKVVLFNFGREPFEVKKGDRIAQLVFTQVVQANLDVADELTPTQRGPGGFGHTGLQT